MQNRISAQDKILKISPCLHWWTYFDLNFIFTGDPNKRVWFVEHYVPKMHKAGLLKRATRKNDKRLYYSSWSQPMHLEHGLVCTRSLLRFWAANKNCDFISENEFRAQKFGVVPEWGILYPNNDMILCEYCTPDNVGRKGLVIKKVNLYRKYLHRIERHFSARALVVMLLDTKATLEYATRAEKVPFIYFVDVKTFFSIEPEEQIEAKIYISAGDREVHSLTDDTRTD